MGREKTALRRFCTGLGIIFAFLIGIGFAAFMRADFSVVSNH